MASLSAGQNELLRQALQPEARAIVSIPRNRGTPSTDWRDFRQISVIGHDQSTFMWVNVHNQVNGRNVWSPLHSQKGLPKVLSTVIPLGWTDWPISLERAFEIAKHSDDVDDKPPWSAMMVAPFDYYFGRTVYSFIDKDGYEVVAVDVMNGQRIVFISREWERRFNLPDCFKSGNQTTLELSAIFKMTPGPSDNQTMPESSNIPTS